MRRRSVNHPADPSQRPSGMPSRAPTNSSPDDPSLKLEGFAAAKCLDAKRHAGARVRRRESAGRLEGLGPPDIIGRLPDSR
jgi:hypothetical protein